MKLTDCQVEVVQSMYAENGNDGRRKDTVVEIADTFGMSRKTVYRHLEQNGSRR